MTHGIQMKVYYYTALLLLPEDSSVVCSIFVVVGPQPTIN